MRYPSFERLSPYPTQQAYCRSIGNVAPAWSDRDNSLTGYPYDLWDPMAANLKSRLIIRPQTGELRGTPATPSNNTRRELAEPMSN